MSSRSRFTFLSLTLVATAWFAIGCGTTPTAPPSPAADEPTAVNAAQRGPEAAGLIGDVVGTVVTLVQRTLWLVGSLGGSLTNGRWRVEIPANAVDGNGTVTLGVASSTAPSCQLEISPATLNHFSKPVTLTIDCR